MQRIVVLTRHTDSYSARRFAEAALALDSVALDLVDPHELYLALTAGRATVGRPGNVGVPVEDTPRAGAIKPSAVHPGAVRHEPLWHYAIPRSGSTGTEYALSALLHLEQAGVQSLNSYSALMRLRHKFSALSELAAAGLAVPDTMMLRVPNDVGEAVGALGGYPVVLKFIRGSQGVGVVYADNASVAQSVLEALNLVQYDVMVQRYYPRAAAGDVRVLTLGGQARWALKRTSAGGEFRANFHRGAQVGALELSSEQAQLAVAAAGVFGLGFAGVDLVQDEQGGWLVMEVNGSPGFEAAEQVHGRVVAEAVLQHVLVGATGE